MAAKKEMEIMRRTLELVKKDLALESVKFQLAEREKFRLEAELKLKASEHEAIANRLCG